MIGAMGYKVVLYSEKIKRDSFYLKNSFAGIFFVEMYQVFCKYHSKSPRNRKVALILVKKFDKVEVN